MTRQAKQKQQFKKTEQAPKPDVTGIVEYSGWKFKATMMNTVRFLLDKMDRIQENMDNVRRKVEIWLYWL